MIQVEIDPNVTGLMLGIVQARGLAFGPASQPLRAACSDCVYRVLREGMGGGEARREAVRRMLRAGGFKASGRNKPAQEYLLRTVTDDGELPAILSSVDWLNAVSLDSGLPISLLSARRLGARVVVRYGQPHEKFVFNRAGQELELDQLICVCAADPNGSVPMGTPIKDSMTGKVNEHDSEVVAFIYAPKNSVTTTELEVWCEKLGQGYQSHCGAEQYERKIVADLSN